jgi:PAS domain S-box-containing protein
VRLVGTLQDVTREKEAEEDLRASELRYRRIVETTYNGVWVLDRDGRTTYVNKRLAEMLGWCPEEMLGAKLVDLLDVGSLAAFREGEPGRGHGAAAQFETKATCKDGRRLPVLVAANPLYDDQGQYLGALALLNDLTDWDRSDAPPGE